MSTVPKWDEERETKLTALVGSVDTEVPNALVESAATELETTNRSIASKLRRMGYTVESAVQERKKSYSEAEEAELKTFLEANSGSYTYSEIAAQLFGGKHNAKSIQGKLLSMELTAHVKATPKQEAVKKYTDEEEVKFIAMVEDGAFIEDLAQALNKSINSIRGKALSLNRQRGLAIPKQRESTVKPTVDALDELGDSIQDMTVAQIADEIGKSERGVKTMLTHRGLVAQNYDGAKKAAKIADKKAA